MYKRQAWISVNTAWFTRIQRAPWDVRGNTGLRYADWYLVNCNHQSWVDIFVLQGSQMCIRDRC